MPQKLPGGLPARIPYGGYLHLLKRRFEEAVDDFLAVQKREGPSDAIASALAAAYHALGFQTLADQVRRSVRSVRGNQWMFRMGHPADHPLRIRPQLLKRTASNEPFPILAERTPVRMDLSHSGWSDIFFLGMDFPEGARVLNVSVDLGVRGRRSAAAAADRGLSAGDRPARAAAGERRSEVQGRHHHAGRGVRFRQGLPGAAEGGRDRRGDRAARAWKGSGQSLADVLAGMVGPGLGLEIVSKVNDIPKGSRLAVSTNLLAAIITACMRATGQIQSLTGASERAGAEAGGRPGDPRRVAGRLRRRLAGLRRHLAGHQDDRRLRGRARRPGIRRQPRPAPARSPHLRRSRSAPADAPADLRQFRAGPRRDGAERRADPGDGHREVSAALGGRMGGPAGGHRRVAIDRGGALRRGDVRDIARATTRNFFGPIQTIIPWASNHYTETLIEQVRRRFGASYWGFLMLGGISGGGMGFIFDPPAKGRGPGLSCRS